MAEIHRPVRNIVGTIITIADRVMITIALKVVMARPVKRTQLSVAAVTAATAATVVIVEVAVTVEVAAADM